MFKLRFTSVKTMRTSKVTAIYLAALMLLMMFSQISLIVDEEGEFLDIDPVEKIQYVSNSYPMSTISNAVHFSDTINSSISGFSGHATSPELNESIITRAGGGEGNHWWKTPTIGSQFTVNISLDSLYHQGYNENDSWAMNHLQNWAHLEIGIYTNSGTCGSGNVGITTNLTFTCTTPQSGGMAYIRIAVHWDRDAVEVLFNYTLEVAEYLPPAENERYCDAGWSIETSSCDSTMNSPIDLNQDVTELGTLEGWHTNIYDDQDYLRIVDGLSLVHRVNITTERTSAGPFFQHDGLSLRDCNGGSIQLSSEKFTQYLDCWVFESQPMFSLYNNLLSMGDFSSMNWTVSYTLTEIAPIEDDLNGDISGAKMIFNDEIIYEGTLNSFAHGSGNYVCCDQFGNWYWDAGIIDGRDIYDINLEHGYAVDFRVSSDADIEIEIPNAETCNEGTVNVIQIQAGMPLTLSCTSDDTYDWFRVNLVTTSSTNGTANYTIKSMVKSNQIDTPNQVMNDIGGGKDAPAVNEYGSGSEKSHVLPLGTSTGGFTHLTDLHDSFNLEIPPNSGRLVFIKADGMSIDEPQNWDSEGDLLYRYFENDGQDTIIENFQIDPNDRQAWIRSSDIMFSPSMYIQQEYTISVHEIQIDDMSWQEHIMQYQPDFIGGGENIFIPEYQSNGNISEWNLYSSSNAPLLSIPIEFDPIKTLTISASQASGEPVTLKAYNPNNGHNEYAENDIELVKYYEGGFGLGGWDGDSSWDTITLWNLDGSSLNITTQLSSLNIPNTIESDTWFASTGSLSGRLGMSGDEGFDDSDAWTITINEDQFYEITIETEDVLDADFYGGTGVGSGSKLKTGCWNGVDNEWDDEQGWFDPMGEKTNYSVSVDQLGGLGSYTIHYAQGGNCSYSEYGFYSQSADSISPDENIFFSIYNKGSPSNYKLEIFDSSGKYVSSMPIVHIDNASTYMRNIRATIPSEIEEGSYDVRLQYNGIFVDETEISVTDYGQVTAISTTGVLGPDDSPTWLIGLNSYGEKTSGEWDFVLDKTWVREIDGTPTTIDSVQLPTPLSDKGTAIVGTELPWQPRPGAKIWQTCNLSSTTSSDVAIPEDVQITRSWTVSVIDLTLGWPIATTTAQTSHDDVLGTIPKFSTSQDNPSNDIFYTIYASLDLNGAIPVEGVSGIANLHSSSSDQVYQTQSFETNNWGEASITFDYSSLPSGNYTVELDVDEQWEDWVSDIPDYSVFAIESNWQTGSGGSPIVEVNFDFNANIRRSTLVAGETIEIDWSIISEQNLNELTWSLFDDAGRILAADSVSVSGTEGLLTIEIPESLDAPLSSILYITAKGEYGSTDSAYFTINNIADNTNLIINIQPDMARPGDTLTVKLELDSDINYIYWDWSLTESGYTIANGNGWEESSRAEFEFELERRNLQNLVLQVNVIDGMGQAYNHVQNIELRDWVELSIQSAFKTNAGETLPLNWEIISPSLTQSDKVSVIEVSLMNVGTGEEAYQNSKLADGFKGQFQLVVPNDIRLGTYLVTVSVETVDGRTLTSENLIDVDGPLEKNIILGIEFPPWSSMFDWFAVLFLIVNLVAIWMVLYRKRNSEGSNFTLPLMDEEDNNDMGSEEYNQIYDDFNFDSTATENALIPSASQVGTRNNDGNEWLMHPEGSNCWWYRQEEGTEWTRSE